MGGKTRMRVAVSTEMRALVIQPPGIESVRIALEHLASSLVGGSLSRPLTLQHPQAKQIWFGELVHQDSGRIIQRQIGKAFDVGTVL